MNIDIKGIKPEERLFHNVRLKVYPKRVRFEEIRFWEENYRTTLHLELLEVEKRKPISQLTLAEITDFLVERPELRLAELASSIEKNGVKVPLIVLTNGILLDGNRRYFACSYICHKSVKKRLSCPEVLYAIPVFVIKDTDVDETIKRKILAEANFVEEYKVPWSLDVKAKVIGDFYRSCIEDGSRPEEAYEEIQDVYGVKKVEVEAYLETMELTSEFIATAQASKKNRFRELVQARFVYFWEFRNKALKGPRPLNEELELPKVKQLFFEMIELERLKNLKQVEPMIQSVRDKDTWEMLYKSRGAKIDMVEAIIKERKVIRSGEDKVRNFLTWLQTKADPTAFTKGTLKLIEKLARECSKLLKSAGV
jgi:ParB-like chromosome segregation protein Spo0J